MFDATDLFWSEDAFKSLYIQLEGVKLDPHVEPRLLEKTLDDCRAWLGKGVSGFRSPNESSRAALQRETHLIVGNQRYPVEKGFLEASFTVSQVLVR